MIEITPTPENIESPALQEVRESHEVFRKATVEELKIKQDGQLFHNPDHTLGSEDYKGVSGVAAVARLLVERLKANLPLSLGLNTARQKEEFEVFSMGLEGGALAHDVVMEIDGIKDDGTVKRSRGWAEGLNEFESATWLVENSQLSPDNPFYDRYINTGVTAISATDPDEMNFNARTLDTSRLEGLSDKARALLTDQNTGEVLYAHIGSSRIKAGLEALLLSTADLAAVVVPERFYSTGNDEFFELNYTISRDCAQFMTDETSVPRERLVAILKSMQGWRMVQAKVALGQRIRLEDNFTTEKISNLFKTTFGVAPDEAEVTNFVQDILNMKKGMDASIEASVQTYEEIMALKLSEAGDDLSVDEVHTMHQAINLMQGDLGRLTRYVERVDRELKKKTG